MSPDHNLLTWCRGAIGNDADRRRLEELLADLEREKPDLSDPTMVAVIAEISEFAARSFDGAWMQIDLAAKTPALTIEGLRAKAALVGAVAGGPYVTDDLSRSLAADVCALIAPHREPSLGDILDDALARPLAAMPSPSGAVH